jgi:hypothetical protein
MEVIRGELMNIPSAIGLIKYILGTREYETMRVITFLWLWWLERNRIRDGEAIRDPSATAYTVMKICDEYLAIGRIEKENAISRRQKACWSKPVAELERKFRGGRLTFVSFNLIINLNF